MAMQTFGEDKPLTWREFEDLAQEDIDDIKSKKAKKSNMLTFSEWIYRGQSSKKWGLKTSLERYFSDELKKRKTKFRQSDYFWILSNIVPAINSLTGHNFERFSPNEEISHRMSTVSHYELLCYARHHGFPTPTLDWTKSYHVAAFFAFAHATSKDDVAIYAYNEFYGEARGSIGTKPIIVEQGPYVETHPRHYKQQSLYTVCRAKIKNNLFFMNHESAVKENPCIHRLKKFILKAGQKENVLEMLFKMNINDYTLFGDEESLMRMLAFKEFRDL